MNYTVTAGPIVGHAVKNESVKSESQAKKVAREWATSGKYESVFVEFYRAADGQHGYINQNGANFTGKNWVVED